MRTVAASPKRRRWWQGPRESSATPINAWAFNGPLTQESLTAAAKTITTKVKRDTKASADEAWQAEAWAFYDQVGELRFVSNAIASRLSEATLHVYLDGVEIKDEDILPIVTRALIKRLGLNLYIAGSCYWVGLPSDPTNLDSEIDWQVVSTLEGKVSNGQITIDGVQYKVDEIYIDRIWDPHPAVFESADSPVRSALPTLRELVGLTQHVSAQIDSRLAGAGIYWVPNSILQSGTAPQEHQGPSHSDNAVLNAIMQAMLTPIEDRESASAVVPLLLGAPDEAIGKIRYDSFSTPFDKNTKELRDEAIRRLALSLDAPPELLSGMGDVNHWSGWLIADEVIQAHVVPRLSLICEGLSHWYNAVMETLDDPRAGDYTLQADVSHLTQRPNRFADANTLYAAGVIGDEAYIEAGGFQESDQPSPQEKAIKYAIQIALGNAQLVDNLPELYAAFLALLDGTPATGVPEEPAPGVTPITSAQGVRPVPPPQEQGGDAQPGEAPIRRGVPKPEQRGTPAKPSGLGAGA
jgi:hypothetical protein